MLRVRNAGALCYTTGMKWRKPPTHKTCPKCQTEKPVGEFYFVSTRNRYHSYCKKCMSADTYKYQKIRRQDKTSRSWYQKRYTNMRASCLRRDIVFRITLDEFIKLRSDPCYYCGSTTNGSTIDRVDNSQGYNPYNVVPACHKCNRAKNSITIDMCRKVLAFYEAQ